jgi:hypothetical protein
MNLAPLHSISSAGWGSIQAKVQIWSATTRRRFLSSVRSFDVSRYDRVAEEQSSRISAPGRHRKKARAGVARAEINQINLALLIINVRLNNVLDRNGHIGKEIIARDRFDLIDAYPVGFPITAN